MACIFTLEMPYFKQCNAFTNNSVLVSIDKVEFLWKHDVHLVLSLDGPKEIQEKNRIYVGGKKSSYDVAVENLNHIREKFPEYIKRMNINIVINPMDDLDVVYSVFQDGQVFSGIHALATTISCRQTLAYEKEFRTGEISYEMKNGLFDSFNPEVVQDYFANGEPFASLDPSYMTVGLLRQCAALGIKTVTLPIPNELGGVTAEIGSYAMGNRNTKHPAEVKALLAYLLSEECQSSSAFADKDMFPVRRGCLKKCMEAQYQFSVYDASHEKIGQEDIKNRKEMYGDNLTDAQLDQLETICDKINAAQYHTIWYRALQLDQSEDGGNLLSETMVQYWNDEITLDELVDRLTPRLKLYLDE